MYNIITGMSESYFNKIGKSMIESWLKFWPVNYTLVVYTEDTIDFVHDRVKFISLDTMDQDYVKFQNQDFTKLNSRVKTFAKKAWPIMENLKSDSGKLLWVDADVIFLSKITESWLETLISKDEFSAHLGVPQTDFYAVETGFFLINLDHQFKDDFLRLYRNIYLTRDFSDMKKPFDGDVFGKVITLLSKNKNFKFRELSPDITIRSPFNTVFRDKMKHYKAKRKNNFNKT